MRNFGLQLHCLRIICGKTTTVTSTILNTCFVVDYSNRMRFEIKNQLITFYLDNPKRAAETIATQSFAGTGLSEQQIIPLAESLVKKFRGQLLGSQSNVTTAFLRPLFSYLKSTETPWPTTSADWQLTVFGFFQFFLVDTAWSQAKTVHRMRLWQTLISGLLEFLIEEEIIPLDVKIPKIYQKRIHSLAKDQPLLGQPRAKFGNIATQPKKLLVDISFGLPFCSGEKVPALGRRDSRHLYDSLGRADAGWRNWTEISQTGNWYRN